MVELRPAVAGDVPALQAVAFAAYEGYVSRMGKHGGQLLAFAETYARQHELSQVRLYTNEAMTENRAYYPRRGYVETHRAEQDGFRRVFFRKLLDGGLRDP